jgi:hypothetical protein
MGKIVQNAMWPPALQHVPRRMTVLCIAVNSKRRTGLRVAVAVCGILIWVALPSEPTGPIHIGSVAEGLASTALISAEELTKS